MQRRDFIKNSSIATCAIFAGTSPVFKKGELIYGQNEKRYRLDKSWVKASPENLPVNDCHEMVQDQQGRIVLLTNETRNNLIFFDKSGKVLKTWGSEYPGAHGLTIFGDGKEQLL